MINLSHESSNETLEEKVERLEYYIHQLRDYIVAPDRFRLWDWSMSHRLNQVETRGLIDLAKEFNQKMKEISEEDYSTIDELKSRVSDIVYQDSREGFQVIVDNTFLTQYLEALVQFGPFKIFTTYYLGILKNKK